MKKTISAIVFAYFILHTAYSFSQGTAINSTGAKADSSAILDLSSTTKGMLVPRMTTAERNAIVSPAQALQIYNTTTKCFEFWENGIWQSMYCACTPPAAPDANAGSGATSSSIEANWSVSSGATTYFLDVSTDNTFAGFVSGYNNLDVGNTTTATVTGLTCATTYYYRIRANNTCGTSSNSDTIAYATSACFSCGDDLNISHTAGDVAPVDKSVSYGTVYTNISGDYKCWITKNLGAANQATAQNDATEEAAGWYWQFNRKQGFRYTTGLTPAVTWDDTPDNQSTTWEASKDPCTIELGTGWRIPTSGEWTAIDASGPWTNWDGPWNSILKLSSAGFIIGSTGVLSGRGSMGAIWSSSQGSDATKGIYMNYSTPYCGAFDVHKAYGCSLRCVKD